MATKKTTTPIVVVLPTLSSAWITDGTLGCQWVDDDPLAPTAA